MRNPGKRYTKRLWDWVSKLPMEKGLPLGGLLSLGCLNISMLFQKYVQAIMNSGLDLIWDVGLKVSLRKNVRTLFPKIQSTLPNPILIREGVVSGMLLTPAGIFYIQQPDLSVFQAIPDIISTDSKNDGDTIRLCEHSFSLFGEGLMVASTESAVVWAKGRFDMFLSDCLLHMLLNDIYLIYLHATSTPLPPSITEATMELIKVQPPPYAALRGLFISSQKRNMEMRNTKMNSETLITRWCSSRRAFIQDTLKQHLSLLHNQKVSLFYSNEGGGGLTNIELLTRQSQNTMCVWRKRISSFFRVDLVISDVISQEKPMGMEYEWMKIGQFRYFILGT